LENRGRYIVEVLAFGMMMVWRYHKLMLKEVNHLLLF